VNLKDTGKLLLLSCVHLNDENSELCINKTRCSVVPSVELGLMSIQLNLVLDTLDMSSAAVPLSV